MKRRALITKFREYLVFRNYAAQTIKSYLIAVEKFIDYTTSNTQVDSTAEDYARAFLTHLFLQKKSWSTVNIHYSALRLVFIHVLKTGWDYDLVPRPKGRASLPSVLSGRQVESMINATKNIKHKTIILLLYSTGIRISEIIKLDREHLLLDRCQLKIVKGKGGKDRIVMVPETTIKMLTLYLARYTPEVMLFDGDPKGRRYSRSSIGKVIRHAAERVGVPFTPSAHSFRYAYATHHLELGTNLVTLQYQLGHSDASTTIKYVRLCQYRIQQIKHPVNLLRIILPGKTT